MKFRHRIEQININGLKEYSVQYFLSEQLLIGRGSSCQLRLPDRSVAIRHALLTTNADGSVTIEDITGGKAVLRVNNRAVKKKALKKGDKVLVGAVSLETFFDGSFWGFRETRQEKDESKAKSDLAGDLRRLDLARFFPRQTSLALLTMALIVLIFFAGPVRGKEVMLWSTGPISNAHRLIGMSCESCHRIPFQPVRDAECGACHKMSLHSGVLPAMFQKHPGLEKRCAECHQEHTGGKHPFVSGSQDCARCHESPDLFPENAKHPKVATFDTHPGFRVSTVKFISESEREVVRSVLSGDALDSTRLAFGHKLHMKEGLRGLPKDKKSLGCNDCHTPLANRREMMPVTYEKQCASCHPLTFDERLPEKFAPHGDSGLVYNFLYAEYSKLFLVSERKNERMATVRRIKPGTTVIDEPDIQFTREFVEGESRNAEKEIFTRTSCKVCHQVVEKKEKLAGESWYTVLKPYLPQRWFAAARFSHAAHENVSCVSCHFQAKESSKTTDILLPQIETCKTCHTSQKEHPTKVDSPCVGCHSFHDSLGIDEAGKRSISDYLLGR